MSNLVSVQVCKSWSTNPEGLLSCSQVEWKQGVLLPAEAEPYIEFMLSGYSSEGWWTGFNSVISLFVVGLIVGALASIIRKAKG